MRLDAPDFFLYIGVAITGLDLWNPIACCDYIYEIRDGG